MRPVLLVTAIVATAGAAHAQGLDFSGEISMGLQSTTVDGATEIEPVARLEGTISYSFETDNGVRFVLAINIDEALLPAPEEPFLPGHR